MDEGVLISQNIDFSGRAGATVDICESNSNDCWCGMPTLPPTTKPQTIDFFSGSGSGDETLDMTVPVVIEGDIDESESLVDSFLNSESSDNFVLNDLFNESQDSEDPKDSIDSNDSTDSNGCSPMDLFCNGEQVFVPEVQEMSCSRKYQKIEGVKNLMKIEGETFANVGKSMMKASCAVDEHCIGFSLEKSQGITQGTLIYAISGEKTTDSESEINLFLDTGVYQKLGLSIDEIKCKHTYSHSVHLSNENTAEERVTNTLSDIFETFAISSVSSEKHSRRMRRSIDQVLNQIQNYGCWCSKPFTGTSLQGLPLDQVDSVCRQWSKCTRCEMLTDCDNQGGDSYSMVYSKNSTEFECFGDSECSESRCLCSGSFGLSLADFFVKGGSLDGEFSDVGSSMCQHSKVVSNGGSSESSASFSVSSSVNPENNPDNSDDNRSLVMEKPSEQIIIGDKLFTAIDVSKSNDNPMVSSVNLVFETSESSNDSIQVFTQTATASLVNMEETCCGEAPTWQPYHVASHSCNGGELVEL